MRTKRRARGRSIWGAHLELRGHLGALRVGGLDEHALVLLGAAREDREAAELVAEADVVLPLLLIALMRRRGLVLDAKVEPALREALALALLDLQRVLLQLVRRQRRELQLDMPHEGGLGIRLLPHADPKLVRALFYIGSAKS